MGQRTKLSRDRTRKHIATEVQRCEPGQLSEPGRDATGEAVAARTKHSQTSHGVQFLRDRSTDIGLVDVQTS